jgi:hypothetical protein
MGAQCSGRLEAAFGSKQPFSHHHSPVELLPPTDSYEKMEPRLGYEANIIHVRSGEMSPLHECELKRQERMKWCGPQDADRRYSCNPPSYSPDGKKPIAKGPKGLVAKFRAGTSRSSRADNSDVRSTTSRGSHSSSASKPTSKAGSQPRGVRMSVSSAGKHSNTSSKRTK